MMNKKETLARVAVEMRYFKSCIKRHVDLKLASGGVADASEARCLFVSAVKDALSDVHLTDKQRRIISNLDHF